VIRKLSEIRIAINLKHQQPFPKSRRRLLSYYCYIPRRIKINPTGEIAGGLSRFVTSLIDFSFVRSICASAYSSRGGHAYDPVSLFLLQLFQWLEKFPDLKTFLSVVRDEEKGKHYRLYAGISSSHVPCEADFTHLKDRLGENLYTEIAQVLVEIVRLLGLLSFSILSTDGTLFPSYSHYKGCTYFCEECHSIVFKGLIDNVRRRILYKLQEPTRVALGRDIKVRVDCPSTRFPEDIQKPKVELLTLSLKIADPEQPNPLNKIFGVEEELKAQDLDVIIRRINFHSINIDQIDSFFFRCRSAELTTKPQAPFRYRSSYRSKKKSQKPR